MTGISTPLPTVDQSEVERYLRIFRENSDSRVFAPLADLYRRMGRLGEAEEICRSGLKRHPYYAGGRVALSHILLDARRLEEAADEAEHVVTFYPDNLLARKILIKIWGSKGDLDRARREYSALLELAPQLAGDPELERSLQGPNSASDLRESPLSGNAGMGSQQSKSLKRNIRKKVILEALLRHLGASPGVRR